MRVQGRKPVSGRTPLPVSIEVTLYLPWGVATGITGPSTYFGHYVANFFTRNDAQMRSPYRGARPSRPGSSFTSESPLLLAGAIVEHDSLRVPPLRRIAWTVNGIKEPSAETPLLP